MNYLDKLKGPGKDRTPAYSAAVPISPSNDTVAMCPAAPNARPVFWEAVDGRILGPAVPELLAQVGPGSTASFWIVTTFEGQPRWINADLLRSRKAFEQQPKVQLVEPIPKDGF